MTERSIGFAWAPPCSLAFTPGGRMRFSPHPTQAAHTHPPALRLRLDPAGGFGEVLARRHLGTAAECPQQAARSGTSTPRARSGLAVSRSVDRRRLGGERCCHRSLWKGLSESGG